MAAVSDLVDITLCEFMEADPPAWKPELNERLEDFVTCLGVQDLRLPEVLFLLNAIGIKYGILTEIQYLVEARLQVPTQTALLRLELRPIFRRCRRQPLPAQSSCRLGRGRCWRS
jgi:hypothetical protein